MNYGISRLLAWSERTAKKEPRISILPAVTLCVLLTTCSLGSCGGGGGGEPAGEDPPPADAHLVIGAVREIGAVSQNAAILNRDCGFSALFQGQSVWLFGDTLLEAPGTENGEMISNSLSCTFDIDAGDGIAAFSDMADPVGAPATFFPLTEDEIAYNQRHAGEFCEEEPCNACWHIWPGTIVVDDDRELAYVFYHKVMNWPGPWNFEHVGHSIAVWKNPAEPPERPVFNIVESDPTLFFSENGEPGFGSAAIVLGKEVFIYGCELNDSPLIKPCHVARVPLANILDKRAWQFYTGDSNWSSDPLQSQEIFNGSEMMSVSFNPYINRFVVVYSEPMGATAMIRTAPHPEGPWSAPTELFSVDAPANSNGWVYDFLAHPEFSQDNGRIMYITYSKKIDELYSELRLVAVELELSQ